MPFCIQCGQPSHSIIPAGDTRERMVCTVCEYIHYVNPNVVCGAIVTHNTGKGNADQVLLCRRAIEPRKGFWTLPAGFMEVGESCEQGALRETLEEAEAEGENPQLYCFFDIPAIGQIHTFYRATLKDGKFGVGVESLVCALFDEADIPWGDLAFYSSTLALKHYFADRVHNHFPVHTNVITGGNSHA